MPGLPSRLPSNRLLRFLIVGVVNSLFGFAVFSGFIVAGSSTWAALVGGNLAGLVFNFFTTGGLVFRDLAPSRAPRFLLCYLATLALNAWLIDSLAPALGGHRIAAQALLTAPMAVFSYLVMAKLVFRPAR